MNETAASAPSRAASPHRPWLHALACLLVLGAFILIAVGGNVTSLDAGMAVPDWPGTFGYNMFLAPIETWGPHSGGVFWEHSHRLVGSAVGVVSIALAAGLWVTQRRRDWLRWLGLALLGMVIVQGLMGGFRVTENSLLLAALHGVFGQVVLAVAVVIAAATGAFWSNLAHERQTLTGQQPAWRWELGVLIALPVLGLVASIALARPEYSDELRTWSMSRIGLIWLVAMAAYMAITLARLALALRDRRRRLPAAPWTPGQRAAAVLLGLLVLQLIVGAAVRHGGAERAIPDAPLAYGGLIPPMSDAGLAAAEPEPLPFITLGQVWLHFAHRVVAVLVCAALIGLLAVLYQRRQHPAVYPPLITTLGLTLLQVMAGIMTVWSEIHPSMATLHQATGAALLAFTTWLTIRVFLTAGTDANQPAPAAAAVHARLGGEPA